MEAATTAPASDRAGREPVGATLGGDERLARLVGEGSERAFATLYERYHQRLYRYCRSILHDDTDAQDALQCTFANALVALRRGRRDAPVRPWLFRIAHNESVSALRRRRSDTQLSEADANPTESLQDAVEGREQLAQLIADLEQLPDRQRGALVLRELSGLSHAEIAIALQTSVGTAKQAIFEARRSLAEFAEGRAMDCDTVCRMVSDGDGRPLRARRVRAHLRSCRDCAAFAAAIPTRQAELRAVAPPLPALAAAGLLARALGLGSNHAGGAGGFAAATAGKVASTVLTTKVLSVVAVAATTAGTTAIALEHGASPPRTARAGHHSSGAAWGAARSSGSSRGRAPGAYRTRVLRPSRTGTATARRHRAAQIHTTHAAGRRATRRHGAAGHVSRGRHVAAHGSPPAPSTGRAVGHSRGQGSGVAAGHNGSGHRFATTHAAPTSHRRTTATHVTHGRTTAAHAAPAARNHTGAAPATRHRSAAAHTGRHTTAAHAAPAGSGAADRAGT